MAGGGIGTGADIDAICGVCLRAMVWRENLDGVIDTGDCEERFGRMALGSELLDCAECK